MLSMEKQQQKVTFRVMFDEKFTWNTQIKCGGSNHAFEKNYSEFTALCVITSEIRVSVK